MPYFESEKANAIQQSINKTDKETDEIMYQFMHLFVFALCTCLCYPIIPNFHRNHAGCREWLLTNRNKNVANVCLLLATAKTKAGYFYLAFLHSLPWIKINEDNSTR